MRRTIPLFVAACLLCASGPSRLAAVAPQSQSSPPAITDPLGDFPSFERSILSAQQAALRVERARTLLAAAPSSVETLEALLVLSEHNILGPRETWSDDALRVARAVMAAEPGQAAGVIRTLMRYGVAYDADRSRDRSPSLLDLRERARNALALLSGDPAAELAYALVDYQCWLERSSRETRRARYEAFVRDNAPTPAALRAELELLAWTDGPADRQAAVARIDRFVRDHDGACVAGEALSRKAFLLRSDLRAGTDPTDRTLQILEIARQLESPPYAACRDPQALRSDILRLVLDTYPFKPVYAAGHVDRLISAYEGFIGTHFTAADYDPSESVGYLIASRLGDLYEQKGSRIESLDRFLVDLAADGAAADAARYLRALIHRPNPAPSSQAGTVAPFPARTVELLNELRTSATEPFRRKALATLAWLHLYERDFAEAARLYEAFGEQFPESSYAWVAALRAGQARSAAGDWTGAARLFQTAAGDGDGHVARRVLGHVFAARAFEALGRPSDALAEYQSALRAWSANPAQGFSLGLSLKPARPLTMSEWINQFSERATFEGVARQVARLRRTSAAPGADVVERARHLTDRRQASEAIAALAGFEARYKGSANVPDARYLRHRAQLAVALESLSSPGREPYDAGVRMLDALEREPYDFNVCAAAITRATLAFLDGRDADPARLLQTALDTWQRRKKVRGPATPLEADVAAIRQAVFLPLGGGILGNRPWNGFSWPAAAPRFLVVNEDVTIRHADRRPEPLSFPQSYRGLRTVLTLNSEQIGQLVGIITALGGVETRPGRIFVERGTMEPPVVPVGRSRDIIAFFARFFEARPGHWGGWELETYPVIREIEFDDAERTRARARVTIGYAGCDVLLERSPAGWRAVRVVNEWET